MTQTQHRREIRPRQQWSPVEMAAYELVRTCTYQDPNSGAINYGAEAMAKRTGRNAQTIANESNPNYLGAKQGLVDAIDYELVTQRPVVLYAHAQMLNHAVWPLPAADLLISDVELLTAFSAWQAAIGTTCQEIHNALDPDGPGGGAILPDEAHSIAKKGGDEIGRFMQLLDRVRALAGISTPHFISNGE